MVESVMILKYNSRSKLDFVLYIFSLLFGFTSKNIVFTFIAE